MSIINNVRFLTVSFITFLGRFRGFMNELRRIGHHIKSLERIMNHKRNESATKSYVDSVTGTHGWVIRYLYDNREKDIFQRDIEKTFGIRRSTVTVMLKTMEKNGLITRTSVENDARLKKITPTDKALDLHYKISGEIDALEEQMTKGISDEEIESFVATLQKIKSNLKESDSKA